MDRGKDGKWVRDRDTKKSKEKETMELGRQWGREGTQREREKNKLGKTKKDLSLKGCEPPFISLLL